MGSGSVSACFVTSEVEGGSTYETEHEVSSTHVAHPDLLNKIEELNEFFVKAKGMDIVHDLSKIQLTAKQGEKVKELSKILALVNESRYDSMEVTGLKIKKKEDEITHCVISGKQTHADGKVVGTATTLIDLNGSKFGIEEHLSSLCEEIEVEAYAFFFEKKRAQIEMDFEGKEAA